MEANSIQLGDLIFAKYKDGQSFSGFVANFAFKPQLITMHGTALKTEASHIGFVLIPFPMICNAEGAPLVLNIHKHDVCAAYRCSHNPGFMIDAYSEVTGDVALCFTKVPLPENPANERFLKQ